jgi:fused signal recognition particle receptor
MKRTMFQRMLVIPALAVMAAQPLLAQGSERNAPAAQQPPESKDGAEARAKLNEQQAQFALGQVRANSTSQAEYERQLKAAEEATAKIAADAAAAQAAYEAEKARRDAEYKAAMDKWQADVDACKAGDRSRCAPPAPPA